MFREIPQNGSQVHSDKVFTATYLMTIGSLKEATKKDALPYLYSKLEHFIHSTPLSYTSTITTQYKILRMLLLQYSVQVFLEQQTSDLILLSGSDNDSNSNN